MPTDVLVVGAGPAGSIAALILARAGVDVRLVDRARFPRDKLCGDTVNPGSLTLLDTLGLGAAVRAVALPIRGMLVTGPGGTRVAADYPDQIAGASLTRRQFDQVLLDAAVSAGARFDDGVIVTGPSVSSRDRVHGVTVGDRADARIDARLVIAADGRASRIGSALGLSSFPSQPRRWAFGSYYQGVEGLRDRGEMHVRPGGYVGVAPLPGGLANVCVVRELQDVRRELQGHDDPRDSRSEGVVACRDSELHGADVVRSASVRVADATALGEPGRARRHDRVLDAAIAQDPELRERFAHATRVAAVTVLGPLAVNARAAGCSGLLLAGDAAGFVDPMTGDGLRFAVRGGMLAAEFALRELETGRSQYRELYRARRREFSHKWLVNRALRTLVGSPRGVAVAARVSAHWDRPVRSLITIAGDVRLPLHSSA